MIVHRGLLGALLGVVPLVAASCGGENGAPPGDGLAATGGAAGVGGNAVTGGGGTTGGSGGGAGTATSGGSAGMASGGQTTGGSAASGGSPSSGGMPTTGGALATGGQPPVGGTPASGGVAATGGDALGGTGGAPPTGGSSSGGIATGGLGGSPTSGASTGGGGTGGSPTGGSATGGSATGGSATGGQASGGSPSTCGSATLNPNPFGCTFAWGLADPLGAPLDGYDFLQFMTIWIDWNIQADGSLDTCTGCDWLRDSVTGTNLIPVYYAYLIGFFGHANGLVDGNQCPADNPDCPNLTNEGAALLKSRRDDIVAMYGEYARQSYAVWPTKPLVWLLEGDFIQYTEPSTQSSPLTMAELGELAADITCAIKANMPNAVVALNQSTWNTNEKTDAYWGAMADAGVHYDLAWTTGVPDAGGYYSYDLNASSYNGATATYAYLHQVTGRNIWVDDGCGGEVDEAWSRSPAATVNDRIATGVIAFNHCGTLKSTYESLIGALTPQLDGTCP